MSEIQTQANLDPYVLGLSMLYQQQLWGKTAATVVEASLLTGYSVDAIGEEIELGRLSCHRRKKGRGSKRMISVLELARWFHDGEKRCPKGRSRL